jgi:nitroreductase
METWNAIDSLRVVREFSADPIADEHIDRIIDAGRRAGSSKNLQRWGFVVVRDRDRLARLGDVGPYAGHVVGAPLAIALVCPDPAKTSGPHSIMWDLGRAAQNMVLAAWELGIGSCPATVHEPSVAKEVLQLPDEQLCEYVLSFGYPADESVLTAPKRSGGRLPQSDVRHEETW